MPDPSSRLIEAAVRPFSDNAELKQSAIGFLENRITKNADQGAMITRWDQVYARKRKPVWQMALWAVVVVVSVGIAISNFHEVSRVAKWGKWMAAGSFFIPGPADSEQLIARNLNESEKLLLFGDLAKDSKSERKEALWRSDPDNPAYFADYAGAFVFDNEKLPPDFLKTARRIDPSNAWFTYLAAGVESKDSVKGKSRKSKRVNGKMVYESPKSWEILDQARLDRTMELLREARNQPKCTDYSTEMLRKRILLLPERTLVEQLDSGACLAGASTFFSLRLLRLAHAIAAEVCIAGESGDVQAFHEISSDGDQFLRRICSDEVGTLVDEMGKSIMVSTLAESFHSAAETLRLEHETSHWKSIEERLKDNNAKRQSRKLIVDGKAVEHGTVSGGIIGGSVEMIAKRPETQPPLTDADLKPMRLVDHELLSWVFSYISWILLGLCACLAASYRFRVTVMSRRLALRMEDLLRPSDWGWILAVGVLLPFAFVMLVNRLTPLGGRELGAQGMNLLMPAAHFFGLFLLWLTLPVQVVRWRLATRAGGFGFPGPSLMGCLAAVCAAAFVPLVGWAAISELDRSWLNALQLDPKYTPRMLLPFWAAAALASLSLLWVTGSVALALLGRADRHLYRATSAFVLIKVFAAAMLVIALASIGFKASERYWFKQDWMTKFDIAGPGWSAFESQVAAQMRKELRETLGYDP